MHHVDASKYSRKDSVVVHRADEFKQTPVTFVTLIPLSPGVRQYLRLSTFDGRTKKAQAATSSPAAEGYIFCWQHLFALGSDRYLLYFSCVRRTASRTGSILTLGMVVLTFYSVLGINLFNSEQVGALYFVLPSKPSFGTRFEVYGATSSPEQSKFSMVASEVCALCGKVVWTGIHSCDALLGRVHRANDSTPR